METRKITIVSSTAQSKKEIMSSATTLAELKNDLNAAGIDYAGMTFMEGYSKTELKSDDSVLPTNIPIRGGRTTNELVFMLTAPQNKIKSGAMVRKDCYEFMKSHPEAAKGFHDMFGKNYTNGSTVDLVSFIEGYTAKEAKTTETYTICNKVEALIKEIYNKGGLNEENYLNIMGVLNGEEPKPVSTALSDEDIASMFDFI